MSQFKLSRAIVLAVVFSGAISLLGSCSAPRAKAPDAIQFRVPESTQPSGFGLSGEAPQGVYRGGLLFWSKSVASDQIKTLLLATKETNQKYVALQKYFTEFMRTEVTPMRERLEQQQRQFQLSKAQSNARVAPLQAAKAAAWFDSEMGLVQAEFPNFDRARVENVFKNYCEAKILDLATRPLLANAQFSARPTPSALCEAYYKTKFFDGPECASTGAAKNYYNCIWNEGVLRTDIANRMQIRVAERRGGVRTSQPLTLQEFSSLETIRDAFAHKDVPFCAATEVRRNVLSGVRFRVLTSGVILGGLSCGQSTRFEITYGASVGDSDLTNASPAVVVNAIEGQPTNTDVPDSFLWLERSVASQNQPLAQRMDAFARQVALFHAGVTGCDSELNSANDVFFNDGRLSVGQNIQSSCKDNLPPMVALPDVIVADLELETLRTELSLLETQLKSLKGNSCTVTPSCDLVPDGHARCDFLNAQVRKAAAAEVRGVADILVTDFALTFERVSANASLVALSMNGAAVAVGCVGESQSGQCQGAQNRPELGSALPMSAEVSAAGELQLSLSIDMKQMAAAGVPLSVIRQFQNFEQAELELSVTNNSFESVVPYLSGKAYLKEKQSQKLLAEGSVSYLIENSFDRQLGEFCSAQ